METKPKGELPTESKVCQRVAQFRRFERRSQGDLSAAIGLTRDQLANIEIGRSILKFWPGWKICQQLNINQLYLATGTTSQRPFQDFDPGKAASYPIAEDDSFLAVCFNQLAMELKMRNDMIAESQGGTSINRRLDKSALAQAEETAINMAHIYLTMVPKPHRKVKFDRLVESLTQVFVDYHAAPGSSPPKKILTASSDFRICSGEMKSALKALLNKVRKLTEPSGMKAKLAGDLGVPQARVSEWLSGKHDPAGETTLQLLRWVELQERQTK